jgi:hypothetical protein
MNILDKFRGEPRPQQRFVAERLAETWDKYDVHVLRLPVGAGKSRLAAAIGETAGPAMICTKDNMLVDQYERDFPDYAYLHRRDRYDSAADQGEAFRRARLGFHGKGEGSPVSVGNYYTWLATRQNNFWFKPRTTIVDEAHTLIPYLEDLGTVKVWREQNGYPDGLGGVEEYVGYLKENTKSSLRKRLNSILKDSDMYVAEQTEAPLRGRVQEVLKFRPWLVRPAQRYMFPWFVKKIVLMSATINEYDIYSMGLNTRKVNYIETDSPIDPFRRPVVRKYVGPLHYSNQAEMMPKVASALTSLLNEFKQPGMIHATYGFAQELRKHLDHPRLLWHTRANKDRVYQQFLEEGKEEGWVLVGSGLYEGIDLAEDLGRWQVICQVPYPSLQDAVWHHKFSHFQELYNWQAVQAMEQASGRICRGPNDVGATFVLDSRFDNMLQLNMFSSSFMEALV